MNQLHITLEENSPAIKWANTQADRIGARGHVGTHLDCYTTVPEKPEYNITAMVLDCQNEMPKEEDIKSLTTLEKYGFTVTYSQFGEKRIRNGYVFLHRNLSE